MVQSIFDSFLFGTMVPFIPVIKLLAGTTGSRDRLSYALIGGTVNLASRIAGLNKTFNSDILVSSATVERLRAAYPMTEESEQMVKGYSKPITVYRVES